MATITWTEVLTILIGLLVILELATFALIVRQSRSLVVGGLGLFTFHLLFLFELVKIPGRVSEVRVHHHHFSFDRLSRPLTLIGLLLVALAVIPILLVDGLDFSWMLLAIGCATVGSIIAILGFAE